VGAACSSTGIASALSAATSSSSAATSSSVSRGANGLRNSGIWNPANKPAGACSSSSRSVGAACSSTGIASALSAATSSSSAATSSSVSRGANGLRNSGIWNPANKPAGACSSSSPASVDSAESTSAASAARDSASASTSSSVRGANGRRMASPGMVGIPSAVRLRRGISGSVMLSGLGNSRALRSSALRSSAPRSSALRSRAPNSGSVRKGPGVSVDVAARITSVRLSG